jgi:hypothetical protein
MTAHDFPRLRLLNQQLAGSRRADAAEVVGALGAVQGQDYGAALWAIGARVPGLTEAALEQAIAERKIIRTWPMRGTAHFIAADDVRWMLELLATRVMAGTKRRREELELDDAIFARCRKVIKKALKGGGRITRPAFLGLLEREGISTKGGRNYHIPFHLAMEGLLCFGPREGKQHTFVLLDEWLPATRILKGEAALGEIALRYFTSHGPATLKDFIWWTGLKAAEARLAIEAAAPKLAKIAMENTDYWMPPTPVAANCEIPRAHLLPGFDEYLLGYTNRTAVLDPRHTPKIIPGNNGVFMPMLVLDGRIVGTWKRAVKKKAVVVKLLPFAKLKKGDQDAIAAAAELYGKFIALPVEVELVKAGQ